MSLNQRQDCSWSNIALFTSYTPYEGLYLKSRKLGVFGRKLEGSHSHSIIILTNIIENGTIMFT